MNAPLPKMPAVIAAEMPVDHVSKLGWAFTHGPTREAYRRSTGEDVAPALDRYREWVEENVVGKT